MAPSSGVKVRVGIKGRTRYHRAEVYRPGRQQIRMELAGGRIAQAKRNLSWAERDAYIDIEQSPTYNLFVVPPLDGNDDGMDTAPFGEEGHEISHEGNDYEVFDNVVLELSNVSGNTTYRRHDSRDRRDRIYRRLNAWRNQIHALTDAYLHWAQGLPPPEQLDEEVVSATIHCIDLFEIKPLTFVRHVQAPYVNIALVHNGALGCAPYAPSVCFTFRTLDDFRQASRFNPRVTIQSQVRKFCALHNVPYRHYLVTQFSIAYDVYLDIQRQVDARVNNALGRDSKNWRLLNSCPACEYRLKDEISLTFSKLIAIDGNNSLRRIDPTVVKNTAVALDTRVRQSDIWVKPEDVDRFRNEVRKRVGGEDVEGDVTEGSSEVTACVERWRAAGPEERKRMWKMFVESGVFIAVCRHGFLLCICDMIQSGELAKYPLALVDRLLDVYGSDLAIGYDIGCAFATTIRNSRLLSEKAAQLNLRMLVPSFHGYAHNRTCQLQWHPMYITGAGLEDFETCERVFSQSNSLASRTRHASAFHRLQAIEDYFKFWDEEKYFNLSQFLKNNYTQALKIISEESPLLAEFSTRNGYTAITYEAFLQEERRYLQQLKTTRAPDELEVAYVKALEELEAVEKEYNATVVLWDQQQMPEAASPDTPLVLANLSRQIAHIVDIHTMRSQQVLRIEERLGIAVGERWGKDHSSRLRITDQLNHQDYCKAVDTLERLVVMRLFELTKLNQSGTAYKMRRQIQKQLASRSEAIKTAVRKYNRLARLLDPPRETLEISKVLEYAFLAEFDLLRSSQEDIRACPWAIPINREHMQRYFRIHAAQEEIIRLNVEIRRLITCIQDERAFFPLKITQLRISDPSMACIIEQRWKLRDAVNELHMNTLSKISKLPGFTGTITPGERHSVFSESTTQTVDQSTSSNQTSIPEYVNTDDELSDGGYSEIDEVVEIAYTLEKWHLSLD